MIIIKLFSKQKIVSFHISLTHLHSLTIVPYTVALQYQPFLPKLAKPTTLLFYWEELGYSTLFFSTLSLSPYSCPPVCLYNSIIKHDPCVYLNI